MKRFAQNIAVLAVAGLVGLVIVEGALRLLPGKYSQWYDFVSEHRTTVKHRGLGDGLSSLEPGQGLRNQRPCSDIAPIAVNEDGFRDGPWAKEKDGLRIAVLGDSFTEGLQVGDGEHLSALLERMLGADVLNASVSGYSTVTQLEAYRRLVRPYRPDLTLVFFYVGNDVTGNACALDPARTLCGRVVGERVEYRRGMDVPSPQAAAEPAEPWEAWRTVKAFGRQNFATYLALHDLKVMAQGVFNAATGRVPERWQLYRAEPPPVWTQAWRITEDAIRRLKTEVEADGGRLALVGINEFFAVHPDWRRELTFGAGSAAPEDMDPARPLHRLAEIAAGLDLTYLDLLDVFVAYRDRHALAYPYFSFSCDGHWNPLGHFVVANATARFLAERGLLPGDEDRAPVIAAAANRRLRLAPVNVLGEEAYRQIYGGGLYRGKSGVPDTVHR